MHSATLDWPTLIRLAALAGADPKTVRRVYEGRPTRPSTRVRVMAALLELGLVPPASVTRNGASDETPSAPTTEGNR